MHASPVFAANIWTHLLASDPFSREAGLRLRRDLYEPGGTVHPRILLDRLLGTVARAKHMGTVVAAPL